MADTGGLAARKIERRRGRRPSQEGNPVDHCQWPSLIVVERLFFGRLIADKLAFFREYSFLLPRPLPPSLPPLLQSPLYQRSTPTSHLLPAPSLLTPSFSPSSPSPHPRFLLPPTPRPQPRQRSSTPPPAPTPTTPGPPALAQQARSLQVLRQRARGVW